MLCKNRKIATSVMQSSLSLRYNSNEEKRYQLGAVEQKGAVGGRVCVSCPAKAQDLLFPILTNKP